MPRWLEILENEVQLVALGFMASVYLVRLGWLLRFGIAKDLSRPNESPVPGMVWALLTIFQPWAMESTRRKWWQWLEFAVFHVAVAVMIGVSFIIPYAPHWLTPPVVTGFILTQVGGLVTCAIRLYRRFAVPEVRAVSSLEDYVALGWVWVLFATCIWTLTGSLVGTAIYFALVALILIYVPFSKISHYLYFPFARLFFGFYVGRRGLVR
ncbi:MAG: hypothetical protein ACP5UM_03725 [Anaerolineae bacterium]